MRKNGTMVDRHQYKAMKSAESSFTESEISELPEVIPRGVPKRHSKHQM